MQKNKVVNFSKKEISDISIANISTDETTLLFINGKLCLNTFKNFRYRDNIEINELANIEEKAILTFSDTFMNDAMFNLGMSEFDGGHYIKFKKQANVEDPIKIVNLFKNATSLSGHSPSVNILMAFASFLMISIDSLDKYFWVILSGVTRLILVMGLVADFEKGKELFFFIMNSIPL